MNATRRSRLFHWLVIGLLLIVTGFAVSGCGTTSLAINHCELPASLATKSTPQPAVPPNLTLEQQHQQWVRDRGYGAKAAKHADEIIDYVGGNCK